MLLITFILAEDGRSGTFVIGGDSFPTSLLDLPTVVESYKTYDDTNLVKTADIGQVTSFFKEYPCNVLILVSFLCSSKFMD